MKRKETKMKYAAIRELREYQSKLVIARWEYPTCNNGFALGRYTIYLKGQMIAHYTNGYWWISLDYTGKHWFIKGD